MKNTFEALKKSKDKALMLEYLKLGGVTRRAFATSSVTFFQDYGDQKVRVKPRKSYGGKGQFEAESIGMLSIPESAGYVIEEVIQIIAEYRVYVGRKRGEELTVFHVDRKIENDRGGSCFLNNFYFRSCQDMRTKYAGIREAGVAAAKSLGLNIAAVDVAIWTDREGDNYVEVIETNTKPAIVRDHVRAKWGEFRHG